MNTSESEMEKKKYAQKHFRNVYVDEDVLTDCCDLAPVHDHHRPELVSSPSHSSICFLAGETVRNKAALSSRLWSEDSSYPGIPFQVARFLCETSPDLLQQMEVTLHSTNGNSNRGASKPVASLPMASPLLHMCTVTDALALQESVIGGRLGTKPAPPDVVAQVVANVQNQRLTVSLLPDPASLEPSENRSYVAEETVQSKPDDVVAATQSQIGPETGKSSETNKLKLHPFPKDRITTVVERQNWLSGTVSAELVSRSDLRGHRQDATSNRSSLCSSVSELDALDTTKHSEEYLDSPPTASEMNSVVSDRFEVESNFSERFELQSNLSEVSGLEDEEMFRIKKLLLESPPMQEVLKDTKVVDMQSHLDVLREKAGIEGQLEVLCVEVESTNRERSQLQNQLAAARSLASSQAALLRTSEQETEALRLRADDLGKRLSESDVLIAGLRGVLEAKTEEVLQSREEAKLYESDAQQCRIALQELKVDVESKDGAIRGLKNKVAELHVELQNLLQAKLKNEGDLQTRLNQLASEQKMKEWYRQQFQESQAAKGRVQQEIISLQASKSNSESLVEKLRFERDQSRQQMAELQERAVREKEGLLRHLESIEADMRERENTFQQLQRDQGSVEESVISQMKKVEEERAKLVQEAFHRGETERQLVALKSEAEARAAAMEKLEKEVAQLIKQLTILQKTMSEKELEIHLFGERHAELENRNKELQLLLQAKEKQLDTMKQGKVAIEVELKAVRGERSDIDATLVDVRNNVLKLDGRLKQMREEMNVKVASIDKLRQEKLTLEEDLKTKDILMEQQRMKLSKVEDDVRTLKEDLHGLRLAKGNADRMKEKVSEELLATDVLFKKLTGDLDCAMSENVSLKEKIKVLEIFNVSSSTKDDLVSKLGKELSETKKLLTTAEDLLRQRTRENQELQKSAAFREVNLSFSEQSEAAENGACGQGISPENDITALQGEAVESVPMQEFATQTECGSENESDAKIGQNDQFAVAKFIQTETVVETLKSDIKEQRRRYESNISVLTRKLKASLKINKTLQVEVKKLEEKLAEKVEAVRLLNSEQVSAPQTCNSNDGRSNDIKMIFYRKKIKSLESKLTELQKFCEEEQRRANHNQNLLIELEKQKGKLHALAEHRTALKQQTSELEAALSEKETAISELDLQARDVQARKQREETQLRESLKELQHKFAAEQESTRDLRKQVFKEKCESSHLRKHAAGLKSSLDEVSRMLDTKKSEMTGVELELEKQQQLAYNLRAEVGALEMKLLKSQDEIDRLRKEVEQSQAKDPLLADQIKTLGWHLHQKNQVISALKDQSKQKDEQCRGEVERMENALQSTKHELEAVKSELQATLKEKFDYQSQVTELRSALKVSLERNKAYQTEYTKHLSINDAALASDIKLFESKLFESPAPYDESLIASLLQKSLTLPESRPLSNLQVCLNTLKQEMAILQQQLLNQTNETR